MHFDEICAYDSRSICSSEKKKSILNSWNAHILTYLMVHGYCKSAEDCKTIAQKLALIKYGYNKRSLVTLAGKTCKQSENCLWAVKIQELCCYMFYCSTFC